MFWLLILTSFSVSAAINDYIVKQWIKDYTLASCKYMLGEARSKFATVAGPQGGTSLNGDALKAEAQAEMDRLISDLQTFVDQSEPLSWIQG